MEEPQLPFTCLQNIGFGIFKTNKVLLAIYTLVVTIGMVLGLLEPILHYEDLDSLAGGLEIGLVAFQWLVKCAAFCIYRKTIRKIIQDMNQFWPLRSCGKEQEVRLLKIHSAVMFVLRIFVIIMVMTSALMFIKSVLTITSTKMLPLTLYHIIDFKTSPYFELMYLWYFAFVYSLIQFFTGYDGLFLVFITRARTQLGLLSYKLRHLKVDTLKDQRMCMKLVKKYVAHHVFILNLLKEIRTIYSNMLIIQFFTTTLEVCMSIYMVNEKGISDVVFAIRCSSMALASTCQLMLYCVSGTQVKIDMENIADAIYESNWWKADIAQLRRATLLIIQRSQRMNTFQAGGMVDLDLKTFLSILRLSFSFFTLMSSKKNEYNM